MRPIEEVLASLGDEPPAISAAPRKPTSPPARQPEKKKAVVNLPVSAGALLQAIRDERPAVGAMLAQGATLVLEEDVARVRYNGPPALAGRLASAETADWIAGMCERRFGRALKWKVIASDEAPSSDTGGASTSQPEPATPARAERPSKEDGAGTGSREELMAVARSEPAVQKLLREFGAQVVDIRPLEEAPAFADEGGINDTEESQ